MLLGSDGTLHTKKISSSVENYAGAIVEGLGEVFRETGLRGGAIEEIRHGTTVASNAILEHKGAKTGLITTNGFRDVLEIRTLRMPRMYDIGWTKPRRWSSAICARWSTSASMPLARSSARSIARDAERAVDALLAREGRGDRGVPAAFVCEPGTRASYQGRSYERKAPRHRLLDIVRGAARDQGVRAHLHHGGERLRHADRARTTCGRCARGSTRRACRARVLLMQSNGGLTTDGAAAERPMHIIESGPAGGVVGAQALARAKDLSRIITFDMGGTTAKASIVEDGEVTRAQEYSVGAGIMIGSRLLTGAGYMLKVPAIDLAEVGAGGGSHVWIDPAGALQIGPESAGASPGPVCYDKGGETPTITDANLLLGYINPRQLVGGALKLNAAKARKVFAEKIAAPLRMSVEQAAHGAHLIAASNMIRAIKAVSTERGRDPRAFALFAFGGNGPVFACGMAAALGMKRVVVPPSAGLFSSFGLLYADVEHHYSRTLRRLLRKSDPREIERAWDELAREASRQLEVEGFPEEKRRIRRAAALHYHGQTYELTVPLPDGPVDFGYLEEAFGREHEKTYGHRAGVDEPVELVSIQLVGQGLRDGPNVPARVRPSRGEPAPPPPRPVYFGSWVETPVMRRSDLAKAVKGPAIVEEYDATCVIPPAARASLDAGGNIVVDLE